jgi:hypothetical protein
MQNTILQPVAILIFWTLIVWLWMYSTRLPAIFTTKPDFKKIKHSSQLRQVLPEKVNWVADNYNHLLEQPVIFYAVCFLIHSIPAADGNTININLAWAYVIIRIIHSLWQGLVNIVPIRFMLFTCSTVLLVILTIRSLLLFF